MPPPGTQAWLRACLKKRELESFDSKVFLYMNENLKNNTNFQFSTLFAAEIDITSSSSGYDPHYQHRNTMITNIEIL